MAGPPPAAPPNVPPGVVPTSGLVINPTNGVSEWWDIWLMSQSDAPSYRIVRKFKKPCYDGWPAATEVQPPDGTAFSEHEVRQPQNIHTSHYIAYRYEWVRHRSGWWYVGAGLVVIGVGIALVATAGWAAPALPLVGGISGTTALTVAGVGGTVATFGGGIGTFVPTPEDDRGAFLGELPLSVSSAPVDTAAPPVEVVTKPCP